MNLLDKRKLKIHEKDVLKSDFDVMAAIFISLKRGFPEFDRIAMEYRKSAAYDYYEAVMEDCKTATDSCTEDLHVASGFALNTSYRISLAKEAKKELEDVFKLAEESSRKVELLFPLTYEVGIKKNIEEE